jgi:hypothetical protein
MSTTQNSSTVHTAAELFHALSCPESFEFETRQKRALEVAEVARRRFGKADSATDLERTARLFASIVKS